MTLNTSIKSIIAEREELVASCVSRQLTQREICTALEKMGKVNPKDGRAWTVATINGDLKRLRQRWRESALQSIEQHQADRLHELAMVKKAAWQRRDLDHVLRAIKLECDILGLMAPERVELLIRSRAQAIADEFGMTAEEILAEAQTYLSEPL